MMGSRFSPHSVSAYSTCFARYRTSRKSCLPKAYLEELKVIAKSCDDAKSFKTKAKEAYLGYAGRNYFAMTTLLFFSEE